jgi:hypothetical protein
MKITIAIVALAMIVGLIPATLVAQPPLKNSYSLAGIWNLKVTVPQMPSAIPAVSICSRDGSLTHIQAAGNYLDIGYGKWVQTDNSAFRITFVTETHGKAGEVKGSLRVQGTTTLSRSNDELTGSAQVEFLNQDGKVVYSGTAKVEGNRVQPSSSLTAMQ